MLVLIKNIPGNIIEFDNGSFDQWCAFLTRPGRMQYPLKDIKYFTRLQQMGTKHGHTKIYNDFIRFYTTTGKEIDKSLLNLITEISENNSDDAEEMDVWFTVIYTGMIAVENKANAILKRMPGVI